jgi:hypothetical protein
LGCLPRRSRLAAPLLLLVTSCASFDLVVPPAREADLYPFAEARERLVVAVDEVAEPERVVRYFGANLLHRGVLPVQVIVSNRGEHRVAIRPADVLLLRGRKVVDPLPLEEVVAIPKRRGLWITRGTAERVDAFYQALAFRETVLAPGETYQGVLFFQVLPRQRAESRFFRAVSLYLEPRLRLRLMATDLDTSQRIGFGPFGIAAGEGI